jgi:hypothetical protein
MTAARMPHPADREPSAEAMDMAHAWMRNSGRGEPYTRRLAILFDEFAAEAVAAERERCAKIAENGCLVPPDGGSPTEDEVEMCKSIAAFIRHGGDECMP